MDSHERGNLVAARPPYSATCTSTHSRSLPFVFWVNFQPLKLFFCFIPFVRVSGSVWQMCVAVREEGEGWESKKWGWGLVWVVAGGGGYRLGGGQSKQAVIKSRIFAIIAVFILQRTASEAFSPLFSTPNANFPTRQPLSSATAKQRRVTVCMCRVLCVCCWGPGHL